MLIEWFAIQMFGTTEVRYSDHHLVIEPVFRPQFEYQSAIQMPRTIKPGVRIENHSNNKQVKISYTDASHIQIPLYLQH